MNATGLPGKWNLNDFTGLPTWNNWDKSINQSETVKQLEKKYKALKWIFAPIKWVLILNIFLATTFRGMVFLAVIAFILSKRGPILEWYLNTQLEEGYSNLQYSLRNEHTDMFVQQVTDSLDINGWRSFRYGSEALIYSDQKVVYLNTDQELLVAYTTANIKDVYKERLHIGARTTGSSSTVGGATRVGNTNVAIGGAQTSSNAETTNFYEWHFDIYTNFTVHPKVSLVMADSPNVEEFVGTAYAILKP